MRQRRVRSHQIKLAIANPAVVFTPRHFGGVSRQVAPADMMMRANLSPAQAGEKALSLICAGLAIAVALLMIDALGQIA